MGYQAHAPKQEESRTVACSNTGNGLISTLSGMGAKGGFSLARQSSIYSLTLDEFQNTLGESCKTFGSMNMDELLKNIWTAEESQAMAAAMGGDSVGGSLGRQQSLQIQGSLSLPRTLSRKTVDDVWKEIRREGDSDPDVPSGGQQRQPTFGEMTLEDFLVKAGVVREDANIGGQSFTPIGGLNFGERVSRVGEGEGKVEGSLLPTLSLSAGTALTGQGPTEGMQLDAFKLVSPVPQQADWITNQYRNVMAQQQHQHILQQQAVEAASAAYANASKRVGNGALGGPAIGGLGGLGHIGGGVTGGLICTGLGAGYGRGLGQTALGLGTGSPTSPASDGGGSSHGDVSTLSPVPYVLDGTLRGRKRGLDGTVEKVVERRQRRMIKNRESAARSRARKQAYTVELEAEVTRLKEENMRLWKQQEEMADKRKKQILDMMAPLSQKMAPKVQVLRRTRTGP